MNSLSKLFLIAVALVFAGSAVEAMSDWNRGISNVHIVHPPGTPPGRWQVTATVTLGNTGAIPGVDLGYDLVLELNGVVFEVHTNPIQGRLPVCAPGSGGAPCVVLPCAYSTGGGACQGFNSWTTGCACIMQIDWDFGTFHGNTGSPLRVTLSPTVGAVDETYTVDDFFNLVVPENDPGTPSCPGDGSGIACPCANSGAAGNGCANASNAAGAHLSATGFTEPDLITGTDSVVLHGSGMPATAPVLYIQLSSGSSPIPFGDGILCIGGSIIRLGLKFNAGGASAFPGPGDPSLSTAGGAVSGSGTTYAYQAYYRDTGSFCTSATFNLTNGVRITW